MVYITMAVLPKKGKMVESRNKITDVTHDNMIDTPPGRRTVTPISFRKTVPMPVDWKSSYFGVIGGREAVLTIADGAKILFDAVSDSGANC